MWKPILLFLAVVSAMYPLMARGEDPDCADPGENLSVTRKQSVERGLLGPVGWDRATISQRMEEFRIPAVAVAVVDGCKLDWAGGYGKGISSTTLFQAGGISQTVTALAALRLAAEGKLNLDAPVFPSGPMLAKLLNHTAGGSPGEYSYYSTGAALPTLDQLLSGEAPSATGAIRFSATAEGSYAYSEGGYLMAQKCLESAAGMPFSVLAKEYVLAPLGMVLSTFSQPLSPTDAVRAATGHDQFGREIPGGSGIYPDLAAAGLWTNAEDIARLMIALNKSYRCGVLNPCEENTAKTQDVAAGTSDSLGPILPADLARRMFAEVVSTDCLKAGLGVYTFEAGADTYLIHWGRTAGYSAVFVCRPSRGQGVAVLAAGDNGEALAGQVVRAVASLQRWQAFEPAIFKPIKISRTVLSGICGVYAGADAQVEVMSGEGTALIRTRSNVAPVPMFTENGVEYWFADKLGTDRALFDGDELIISSCPDRSTRYRKVR